MKKVGQSNEIQINDENDDFREEFLDQLLKENLQEEFSIHIPEQFAEKVCEKIAKRKAIQDALVKQLVYFGFFVCIVSAVAGILYLNKSNYWESIKSFLLEYSTPIFFGVFLLLLLQIADSILLSRTKEKLNNL